MITQTNYMEYLTPQFRRLSDQQLERIHFASLEILERTGVCLYDQEALDLLAAKGVKAVEGNRVRVPAGLVEWALSVVPKRVVMADRNGRRTMFLERDNVYFGLGSDRLDWLDHHTHQLTRGVTQNIIDGTRVADALPNIDFLMSMVICSDVANQRAAHSHQQRAMVMNSTKPILTVPIDLQSCMESVAMAEAVAGGAEALQRNPSILCYINIAHPLRHNTESLQRLLYNAGKGLPSIYCMLVSRGGTAPATLAGAQALCNAGELVGVVLSQLKREGAPIVISGGYAGPFNMSGTGRGAQAPYVYGVRPEIAHYYNLPAFGTGGTGQSHIPEQWATAHAALTLLAETMSGNNLVHNVGCLGGAVSLELVVMCDELINWVKGFMRPVEVNEETLALDLIDEIGPHGHYLESKHTLRHFREEWYPELLGSGPYEDWVAEGSKTFADRAAEKVDTILAEHKVEPLPAGVQKRIDDIVEHSGR